ncbi:hypothetical protein L596_005009 [Steinernema carpocapsae]|uniref:Uncharacterized protein n=1 Tax=Steinernema carpocapsae TaxID=34508 RepID=A0A4U8UXV8_STECR|nr:hypothetical protein L596_005009 [Steinernema carpocapsae]
MDTLPSEFVDNVQILTRAKDLPASWQRSVDKAVQFRKLRIWLYLWPVSETRCTYVLMSFNGGTKERTLCQSTWNAYELVKFKVVPLPSVDGQPLDFDSTEFRTLQRFISRTLRPVDLLNVIGTLSPMLLSLVNAVPRFSSIMTSPSVSFLSDTVLRAMQESRVHYMHFNSFDIPDTLLSALFQFTENCNFYKIFFLSDPRGHPRYAEIAETFLQIARKHAKNGKFVKLWMGDTVTYFWKGVEYFESDSSLHALELCVKPRFWRWNLEEYPESMKRRTPN